LTNYDGLNILRHTPFLHRHCNAALGNELELRAKVPLLMSLDINIDTHTNQRSGIPNSIAMLRLPILTSHFSKSIPFTSFTAHSTLRAGLKLQTPRIKPRRLANMSTQSKACCTVPPVVSEGYKGRASGSLSMA
jgi:hypothetical protein